MTSIGARNLRPDESALVATASVVGAATLGQLLAGEDPRARLAELDTTILTLPFAAWIAVAVAYYAIAGIVLHRLGRRLREARTAFAAVLCVVIANEAWNALLFGFEAVAPAAIGMLFFAALITITTALVFSVDRVAAWVLAPYTAWVVLYDVPWILAVWRNSVA